MKSKRFQECNKLIQLWRYRWYLCIPFWFIGNIYTKKNWKNRNLVWKILIGEAQSKMNWVYTSEEVFSKIKAKINDTKK
jgi:hypothetical protein